MALFKNRLNVNFDYYIRDTKDMLTKGETLPVVLGNQRTAGKCGRHADERF